VTPRTQGPEKFERTDLDVEVRYDPYDVELNADPYPMFGRTREEAPPYFNEGHGFYALSRYDDVDAALQDYETFSSARGAVLEIIQSGTEIPSGTLIFEDPPIHNILDPLIGTGRFDSSKTSARRCR
jgi:cytochrome P450